MSSIAVQVKTVAVIGAGISGVCTAAHLLKQNLDVVLFERSSIAGGVWHFDERPAADPPYPNEKPSSGDYVRAVRGESGYQTPPKTPDPAGDTSKHGVYLDYAETKLRVALSDLEISHAPPGPCYAGLKNNVCLRQMKTTLGEWPDGLEDFVNQRYLEQYIQAVAHSNGINRIAEYNTRVEEVTKTEGESKWRVRTTTLGRLGAGDGASARLIERHWSFDAVVVASGHYNMPRITDIPGLAQWKARFPDRVWHSKRYRSPALFKDKRVLLIGAGVSSNDIAKESDGFATKIFQSSRGGDLDLPVSMLPPSAERIGGIKRFVLDNPKATDLASKGCIPGFIELTNGSKLCDIDHIVLGTGYITSYPFLEQYHADDKQAQEASQHTLVTADGDMVHNLHKDIFFIPDPTLAFVGAPYHVSTFSLFEFQAQVVARVLAGVAQLPATEIMRQDYRGKVAARGLGRDFHSLRGEGEELEYVRDLVAWVNSTITGPEVTRMVGHTDLFLEAYKEQRERLAAFGRRLDKGSGETFEHVVVDCRR